MKPRVWPPLIAVLLPLLLSAAALWAQRGPAPRSFKTCLFPTIDLSRSEDYREYQTIISNQLRVELRNAGFDIIPHEEWDAARSGKGIRVGELYQGSAALEVAREVGAQLAVVSLYSVEDRQLVLQIKCYDVKERAAVSGVFKTARISLTIYNTIAEAVGELIPNIRLLGPPPAAESPVVEEITLLSADEGLGIYLGDEGFVGAITDGKLLLPPIPFAVGSKVRLETRKEGYHSGEETLRLKDPQMSFRLTPLRKQTRTATELNWTLGQLLGFGLAQRFYLKPDSSYLCAEHYFYVQHNFSDSKPVFHHDLRASFGGYLFSGPHRMLRLNVSTGVGMIATYFWLADQPLYTDFYWNVVNLGLELNFRKYLLYIRSEQKYALDILPGNLLGRGWISALGEGPSTLTLGVARKW